MNVSEIQFLPPGAQLPEFSANAAAPPSATTFGQWIERSLATVNDSVQSAEHGLQELAAGADGNLHDVMIRMEQAKLSLQLLLQIRNHVLDAYQDVIRMQI